MQLILIGILIILIIGACISLFERVGIGGVIALMIGGGIGFAIGNIFHFGWAIFGAILGCLIAIGFCLAK